MVAPHRHCDLLGCTIRQHVSHVCVSNVLISLCRFWLFPAISAPDRWGVAMALYIIGYISYGATLVFYAAVFPRLARNTSHSRELRRKLENGEISAAEYEVEESMEKNRISNISTVQTVHYAQHKRYHSCHYRCTATLDTSSHCV